MHGPPSFKQLLNSTTSLSWLFREACIAQSALTIYVEYVKYPILLQLWGVERSA